MATESTYGKNIKQLPPRTSPALTDFLYLVAGEQDHNVTLQALATLFGIEETEGWQTKTLAANATTYLDTEEYTTYAVVKLEYFAKRGSRTYHSGVITIMYTGSGTNVVVNDVWDNVDADDLGITVSGLISSGFLRLRFDVDSSDANDITFNYRTISKKPITVS